MRRYALILPIAIALGTGCDAGKVSSSAAGSSGGAPGGGPGGAAGNGAPPTPQPTAPNGYYASGGSIYTAAGVKHVFHGLDRPSLEWNSSGENLSESDYQAMATWGANVVRISMNQTYWLQGGDYQAIIDQQVQWIEANGMDVILDLHWSDRGQGAQAGQQRMADENSRTFWSQVGEKYKGDGRVQFELYNEPHDVSWDVWLNGGASGDGFTVVGMQALYDAIRATGANNLVIVGGLDHAYDLKGVPSHRVKGYNIAYASHPYDFPNKQPANWRQDWGFIASTDPVVVTEFGDISGSCDASYYTQLIQYADSIGASWTGWAWYVADCRFPSLIEDWSGTPTAAGAAVRSALQRY